MLGELRISVVFRSFDELPVRVEVDIPNDRPEFDDDKYPITESQIAAIFASVGKIVTGKHCVVNGKDLDTSVELVSESSAYATNVRVIYGSCG